MFVKAPSSLKWGDVVAVLVLMLDFKHIEETGPCAGVASTQSLERVQTMAWRFTSTRIWVKDPIIRF